MTGFPASGVKSLSKPMRRLLPAATMMELTKKLGVESWELRAAF